MQSPCGKGREKTLTVVTRTSGRPNYFKELRRSIEIQTVKPFHLVGCDDGNNYVTGDLILDYDKETNGTAPYNAYFDYLLPEVETDYVMFLDDDDKFTDRNAVEIIINNMSKNTLLLWSVDYAGRILPDRDGVVLGHITGIGFSFPVEYCDIVSKEFGNTLCGDYRAIKALSKLLDVKRINNVLTGIQRKTPGGMGKRDDI